MVLFTSKELWFCSILQKYATIAKNLVQAQLRNSQLQMIFKPAENAFVRFKEANTVEKTPSFTKAITIQQIQEESSVC